MNGDPQNDDLVTKETHQRLTDVHRAAMRASARTLQQMHAITQQSLTAYMKLSSAYMDTLLANSDDQAISHARRELVEGLLMSLQAGFHQTGEILQAQLDEMDTILRAPHDTDAE